MYCMFKAHTVYRGSQLTGASCWQSFGELQWHDLCKCHIIKHLPANVYVSGITTGRTHLIEDRGERMPIEQRAKEPRSAAGLKKKRFHASLFIRVRVSAHMRNICILWVAVAAMCESWSRSLEEACCALICALTVCEHSKGLISTLCGISHRSCLSTFISYSHWIKFTIYGVCVCER